jgi:TATA-binding protein-associated factor
LDRLLLLLDTGSSTSVRNTAAKQLAQLAAKSVISDVALEEDIKNSRQHVSQGDPQAWAELMAVVARVRVFSAFCRAKHSLDPADNSLLTFKVV